MTTPEQQTALRKAILDRYNDEELRTLCADLGVDYDDLPAQGRAGKARELVTLLARRNRIAELEKILTRPHESPPLPPSPTLTQLLSSVPTWVWLVAGVVAMVLFIVCGQLISMSESAPVIMSKTIAIQTYHTNEEGDKHRYVTAMGSDYEWVLRGETTEVKAFEEFTILCLNNNKVAFQTYHRDEEGDKHRYVTVMVGPGDDEWRLRGSTTELTKCAQFTLHDVDTEEQLLCLDVFDLLEQGEVEIALQTCRKNDEGDKNRYVSAMNDEDDRDWELWAQTDELKDWEKFTLILRP